MKLEIDIPSIIYNDAKENRCYISVDKMGIAWKAIANGKPLEQEPKKGHWTDDGYCSCCNKQTLPLDISGYASGYDSFCPNCGADMREVEE